MQDKEYKYREWKSAEEMHEESMRWLSELAFIQDEITFLEDLLEKHFSKLTTAKFYENSKELTTELGEMRAIAESVEQKVKKHNNELDILLDGIDQPHEEREVKADHRWFIQCTNAFFHDFKQVKRSVFTVILDIMKDEKRNKLLRSPE